METLNSIVLASGYDGIQLHWARFFRHLAQLHFNPADRIRSLGRLIHNGHESWVGTSDPRAGQPYAPSHMPKGSVALRAASRVLFPEGDTSMSRLASLEKKLGREGPMPHVVFPHPNGNYALDRFKAHLFPGSRIQPTADVAAAWSLPASGDFAAETRRRGYRIAWDSFHGDRAGKTTNARMGWESVLPALIEDSLVDELHVSVFRHDFAKVDPERSGVSIREGKALAGVEGHSLDGTPLGETLAYLRSQEWQGDVTIEAPLSGIAAAIGTVATRQDLIDVHTTFTTVVREALPHMQWQRAVL